MHIPDGYLNDPVCLVTTAASLGTLGAGLIRVRQTAKPGLALPLAATAAGVFAAQMVNFPISPGTSGHLVGAALATWLLGPWAALLAMTVVLTTQCLVFGDGGLSALGANTLNMAVCGVFVSTVVQRVARRISPARSVQIAAAGVAAWCSVVTAAALCSFELAASGELALAEVLSAMLRVHASIGLGETLITLAVVAVVTSSRIAAAGSSPLEPRRFAIGRPAVVGLGLALGVAALLAPLASSAPDGLERVAEDLQFADLASASLSGFAPDYLAPGIDSPALAVALAGVLGVLCVFAAAYAIGRQAVCHAVKNG